MCKAQSKKKNGAKFCVKFQTPLVVLFSWKHAFEWSLTCTLDFYPLTCKTPQRVFVNLSS